MLKRGKEEDAWLLVNIDNYVNQEGMKEEMMRRERKMEIERERG